MRGRGGYIGANVTPANAAINSAASGMWTVREAESLKRAGTWPSAQGPFGQAAVVLISGSSYTVPTGATTMKAWAIGQGGYGASDDDRYGGSGAVVYKSFSVSGGSSVSYTAGNNISSGYLSSGASSSVTYGGATITANGAFSPYASLSQATYSGGDGGVSGTAGGTGAAAGKGINSNTQNAVDVSGLFDAVTLAISQSNAPAGVTAASFGDGGNANGSNSTRPPVGGGGQGGGGTESGDLPYGGRGAVVLFFT
jgi:hypothetical protein